MSHKEKCDCEHDSCECGDECKCGGDCDCGCGSASCHCGGFKRRYQTKAEQVDELKAYLAELRLEVQAVEERLADLEK